MLHSSHEQVKLGWECILVRTWPIFYVLFRCNFNQFIINHALTDKLGQRCKQVSNHSEGRPTNGSKEVKGSFIWVTRVNFYFKFFSNKTDLHQ